MSIMRRIISVILLFLPLTCLMAQNLTILHLNDTHSHIEPIRGDSFNAMGGVIEQAAYVDSVRTDDGRRNVLLLHAGDFSQGTSYFTEFKGDIEIAVLNAFKYDAVALGNHEFDNGFAELARRLDDLNVPALCANYDFTGTEVDGMVNPYCIVKKGRKKIGVIGVLANLDGVISSKIHTRVKYLDPVEAVNKYADILKNKKGCDLVICLSHLGFQDEPFTDQMLVKSIKNVDIIVGGHSHTFLDDKVVMKDSEGKDVVIVTSGKWGVNIGNLKVSYKSSK